MDREVTVFCPQCKAEYRFGFTRCSDCGVRLVVRLPVEFPPSLEDHTELVTVRTYPNMFDADVARGALEAAGIESMIRSDDSGGKSPALAFTRGVELLVRSEDASEADDVLSIDATDRG